MHIRNLILQAGNFQNSASVAFLRQGQKSFLEGWKMLIVNVLDLVLSYVPDIIVNKDHSPHSPHCRYFQCLVYLTGDKKSHGVKSVTLSTPVENPSWLHRLARNEGFRHVDWRSVESFNSKQSEMQDGKYFFNDILPWTIFFDKLGFKPEESSLTKSSNFSVELIYVNW